MKLLSGPGREEGIWTGQDFQEHWPAPTHQSPRAHSRPTPTLPGVLCSSSICAHLLPSCSDPGSLGRWAVLFPRVSAHTDVAGGRVPGASVGNLLALYQAHHPLEVPGVNDSFVVTRLLGVFPIELLCRRGDRHQIGTRTLVTAQGDKVDGDRAWEGTWALPGRCRGQRHDDTENGCAATTPRFPGRRCRVTALFQSCICTAVWTPREEQMRVFTERKWKGHATSAMPVSGWNISSFFMLFRPFHIVSRV